jgi:hypothetical protein
MGTRISNENTATAQIGILSMEQYENFIMNLENGKNNVRRNLQELQDNFDETQGYL